MGISELKMQGFNAALKDSTRWASETIGHLKKKCMYF